MRALFDHISIHYPANGTFESEWRRYRKRESWDLGKSLFGLGFAIGGLNYLITAGYFFANDRTVLGVIQLVVPPAEIVLPWAANTALGIASAVSIVLCLIGAAVGSRTSSSNGSL